jgi:hypothetical protein
MSGFFPLFLLLFPSDVTLCCDYSAPAVLASLSWLGNRVYGKEDPMVSKGGEQDEWLKGSNLEWKGRGRGLEPPSYNSPIRRWDPG